MYTYGLELNEYRNLQELLGQKIIVYGINNDEKMYIHITNDMVTELKYKLERWWEQMRRDKYYNKFFIVGEIDVNKYEYDMGYDQTIEKSWYNRDTQFVSVLMDGYFPDRVFYGGIQFVYDKDKCTNSLLKVPKNNCRLVDGEPYGGSSGGMKEYLTTCENVNVLGEAPDLVFSVNRNSLRQIVQNLEEDNNVIIPGLYRRNLRADEYIHIEKCDYGYGFCTQHSIHRYVKL